MGTLYPGNTTAPGNLGNIASTSTLHSGNTSDNVIYVHASLPYLGVFRWEIQVAFRLLIYFTRGGGSTLSNPRFPAHTTPTNPNLNFINRNTKPWLMVPTYLPQVRVFLMVLFPTYFPLGHRLTLREQEQVKKHIVMVGSMGDVLASWFRKTRARRRFQNQKMIRT
jgi:hypothetical protein